MNVSDNPVVLAPPASEYPQVRVLMAAVVKAPMTVGKVTFAFGTAAEAEQVAAELSASATS